MILNLILGGLLFPAIADDNGPIRLEPTNPENPPIRPKTPSQFSVYYVVQGDSVTIYSDDSIMADIVIVDLADGTEIYNEYTDLSEGATFTLMSNHNYTILVFIDGVRYEATITM